MIVYNFCFTSHCCGSEPPKLGGNHEDVSHTTYYNERFPWVIESLTIPQLSS